MQALRGFSDSLFFFFLNSHPRRYEYLLILEREEWGEGERSVDMREKH